MLLRSESCDYISLQTAVMLNIWRTEQKVKQNKQTDFQPPAV